VHVMLVSGRPVLGVTTASWYNKALINEIVLPR
jgi:hypothetical protein